MVVCKNREVENCGSLKEGSVSGDCKDYFIKKYERHREVKVD